MNLESLTLPTEIGQPPYSPLGLLYKSINACDESKPKPENKILRSLPPMTIGTLELFEKLEPIAGCLERIPFGVR